MSWFPWFPSFKFTPAGVLLSLIMGQCIQAQNPPRLSDRADAVIVGAVESGRQTANTVAFTLRVVRTIKGGIAAGTPISVSGASAHSDNRDLAGHYGMFFLNRAGTNQWTLRPITQFTTFESMFYPLSRNSVPSTVSPSSLSATADEQIGLELAAGIAAAPGSYMLLASLTTLSATPDTAIGRDIFRWLRTSPNPELRFLALARLAKTGDLSALAEIADNVDLVPGLTARLFVIRAILGQGRSGSAAVPYLGRISKSTDQHVQQTATDSLMRLHTRETLPFLAALLDSNFPRTRELAMSGFSRFVLNLPPETQFNVHNGKAMVPQGPAPYRTPETDKYSLNPRSPSTTTESEAVFVQFWKSWWATMQGKVMTTTP